MDAYKLRIELTDCQPKVWREVVIPEHVSFKQLHGTIQYAMGWDNCHLYEFNIPSENTLIISDDELYQQIKIDIQLAKENENLIVPLFRDFSLENQELNSNKKVYRPSYKIDRFLINQDKIIYVYDYGDYWEHDITLIEIIKDYQHSYPQVLDFEGSCPPEDCGGTSGYAELITILSNPGHHEYEAFTDWLGYSVLEKYDIEMVNFFMENCLRLKKI